MPPGSDLAYHPGLGLFERAYVRLLGAPVNGLRNRLRRLRPLLGGDHRRILDAGCGSGVFSYTLARLHPRAEVVGVDIDARAVEQNAVIARRAGLFNCRFRLGDVTDLGEESAFDLVVSADNLEHVSDDQLALRNLARALAPGGRLVLHVPGYYRRWFLFRKRVNFPLPTHVRPGYTLEELRAKVERSGLEVEQAFYTYGWLETVSNNVSYLVTGARRRRPALYGLVFPLLLLLSWLGRGSRPRWGAGVALSAVKTRRGASGILSQESAR